MAHAIGRLDELTARLDEYGAPAPDLPPSPAGAAAEAVPEAARREGYDQIRRALAEAVDDARTSAAAVRAVLRRLESLERAQETLAVTIEQTVIQVRLVPLSDHVPLLQHTAHVLAGQGGKQVEFAVSGEMTGIDREVSEPLVDALTQLVRNAVTHGIEPPDERLALGKPAAGRVWLRGEHAGNEVEIEVGDDGRGINPDQVIASALVAGAIEPAAARRLDPQAALDLIFEQGVTTVDEPSAAAGTGVGMAAVADAVQRLRGSIVVQSVPGRGTAFRLRVPISLGILRALRVRADGQEYALPAAAVLHAQPLAGPAEPAGPAPAAGRRLHATVRGEEVALPLHSLAELLGRGGLGGRGAVALVVEASRARLALAVDEVLAEGDVVVRALPAYLRRRRARPARARPAAATPRGWSPRRARPSSSSTIR
jgi:chemotaxis protein histidine kinase CheA